MEPIISAAKVREAEQILKLQYHCYQREAELYNHYRMPPLTESLADFLPQYDTHRILVIREGEEVVGSVRGYMAEETCHIGRLMVHPRFQRNGWGGSLVLAIEKEFPTVGRYELFTGSRSEGSIRLYKRLGYTVFKEENVRTDVFLTYLEKQH